MGRELAEGDTREDASSTSQSLGLQSQRFPPRPPLLRRYALWVVPWEAGEAGEGSRSLPLIASKSARASPRDEGRESSGGGVRGKNDVDSFHRLPVRALARAREKKCRDA
jgi:hypothetical protein